VASARDSRIGSERNLPNASPAGDTAVAGVEVKAAASVNDADFRGLRKLREAAGRRFAAGVVLYDGAAATRFGDNLFALPLRSLWEDA
jgi:uncharacterized protein